MANENMELKTDLHKADADDGRLKDELYAAKKDYADVVGERESLLQQLKELSNKLNDQQAVSWHIAQEYKTLQDQL